MESEEIIPGIERLNESFSCAKALFHAGLLMSAILGEINSGVDPDTLKKKFPDLYFYIEKDPDTDKAKTFLLCKIVELGKFSRYRVTVSFNLSGPRTVLIRSRIMEGETQEEILKELREREVYSIKGLYLSKSSALGEDVDFEDMEVVEIMSILRDIKNTLETVKGGLRRG